MTGRRPLIAACAALALLTGCGGGGSGGSDASNTAKTEAAGLLDTWRPQLVSAILAQRARARAAQTGDKAEGPASSSRRWSSCAPWRSSAATPASA